MHISLKDARNVWNKEESISNISCYEVSDYFSLKFYSIIGRRAAGVLFSIYRQGPGISEVAIAGHRAKGDT